MLAKAILNNWKTDIRGYAQSLDILEGTGFTACTVKFDDSYGVAIPYAGDDEINESFANAKIQSMMIMFPEGDSYRALVLTATDETIKSPFSALCAAFVDPGNDGELRMRIEVSPLSWWKDWKELLGNRNIDARIYDVLGELCALKYAVLHYENAEWNGPDGASYDIETDKGYIEVKSSINRSRREVTISSQLQLFPPDKPLELILCRFEPSILSGNSIDSLLTEFEEKGYNTELLNHKLELKGFEKNMSARKKTFILHEMLLYAINDDFPRITPSSFIGGVMPEGILKISYTVDLAGLTPISLLEGEK